MIVEAKNKCLDYQMTELGELPIDWEVKELGEIAEIKGGKRLPKGKKLMEDPTSRPYLRVSDMYMGGVSTSNLLFVPEEVIPLIDRYRIYKGEIFISVAGTLGLVGEIPDSLDGVNLTENADRICEIKCDKDYLRYFLMSDLIQNKINSVKTQNAQPKLALTQIKKFKIALPDKEQQKKIADILFTVDEQIEKTNQLTEKTKELKKGLMQKLMTKGIGHTNFIDTKIGNFPSEWEIKSLEEISERITYGFTNPMPSTIEGPFMVTAKDVTGGKINYQTARKTDLKKFMNDLTQKSKPSIGDILITKDGSLGRLAIVDREDICINQSVASIKVDNNKISNEYLYHLLSSPSIQQRILLDAGGSTIKHIYITKLAKMHIAVPQNLIEQKKIVQILNTVDYQLEIYKKEKEKYIELKKALMQQLLTGKLRVTV